MLNLLLKIKKFYLNLKKKYYSIVLTVPKNIYYKNQLVSYYELNVYGVIHNVISSVWILFLFSLLLKDVNYLYLAIIILFFGFFLLVLIKYIPNLVPKQFFTVLFGLSYFYKSEAEIVNIVIYLLFITLLFLNLFFGLKTYLFIRFIFFARCFLDFIFFIYKSRPELQINVLSKNLIVDQHLLNVLHPMESVELEKFVLLKLENNEIEKNEANNILNRYKILKTKNIKTATIPYKREIINDQIVVYEYHNIAQSLNNLLDQLEKAVESGELKD